MQAFAEKRRKIQPDGPGSSVASTRGRFGHGHRVDSILQLQSTIGNQAVQRLARYAPLTTATGGYSTDTGALRFWNVRPDEHEQQADRLSNQVMRISESDLVSRKGQTEGPSKRPESLQAPEQTENGQIIGAPPVVRDAVGMSGEPLDAATRLFMERRFGFDFSNVRIHTGEMAGKSAREINARAYATGSSIVFGTGKYAPATAEGRRLIAHELAHVVQQSGGAVPRGTIQCHPDEPQNHEQWIEELGRDPQDAHGAWKQLSGQDKLLVISKIELRFGSTFAQQFLEVEDKGKPNFEEEFYGVGVGPTTEQLLARGYRLGGMFITGAANMDVEVWFHPSGKKIRKDVSTRKPGAAQPDQSIKQPPIVDPPRKEPPREDCAPLMEMALGMVHDTVSRESSEQTSLEADKAHLEGMNKTDEAYRGPYNDYIQALKALKDDVDSALDAVDDMRKELVDMKCPVSAIDDLEELDELQNLQTWAEIESGPMGTQFLQPFNGRLKTEPGDEGSDEP